MLYFLARWQPEVDDYLSGSVFVIERQTVYAAVFVENVATQWGEVFGGQPAREN